MKHLKLKTRWPVLGVARFFDLFWIMRSVLLLSDSELPPPPQADSMARVSIIAMLIKKRFSRIFLLLMKSKLRGF
jgi:hypothetical protein